MRKLKARESVNPQKFKTCEGLRSAKIKGKRKFKARKSFRLAKV